MRWKTPRLSWGGLIAVLVLVSVFMVILLPGLQRARESGHRNSCQGNLKQLGIVLKMFANESKRGAYPPLSPVPNNWMMDVDAVYPEYVTDLSLFVCPSSAFALPGTFTLRSNVYHPAAKLGTYHPDCVSSLFYVYTGYTITSDEQAVALFDAYYERPADAFAEDIDLDVPVWEGSGRVEGDFGQTGIPVVWDRVPLDDGEFSHKPLGCNVLHMDGHVQFVRYSYYNNSNYFPVTRISAETFGSVLPSLSPDCYGM